MLTIQPRFKRILSSTNASIRNYTLRLRPHLTPPVMMASLAIMATSFGGTTYLLTQETDTAAVPTSKDTRFERPAEARSSVAEKRQTTKESSSGTSSASPSAPESAPAQPIFPVAQPAPAKKDSSPASDTSQTPIAKPESPVSPLPSDMPTPDDPDADGDNDTPLTQNNGGLLDEAIEPLIQTLP